MRLMSRWRWLIEEEAIEPWTRRDRSPAWGRRDGRPGARFRMCSAA